VSDLILGEAGAQISICFDLWKTEEKCIKPGRTRTNAALW
jgi:hypothetical protein